MFSHLYTADDSQLLPFPDYVKRCRELITQRRLDLQDNIACSQHIIDANTPYELLPSSGKKPSCGALLIHGLLNCPFAMNDIGTQLQANGLLVRSILLPGHGTHPNDLLDVSYQDWIQAVQYGIDSLRQEVEHVYLVGYSTGGTLAIHQALTNHPIAGLVLLAPALKISAPIDIAVNLRRLTHYFTKNKLWICKEKEIDYVKYQSIPFNAVAQVSQLTTLIKSLALTQPIHCPIFMAISHEDETVSCEHALDFFNHTQHPKSEMLLYSTYNREMSDSRIKVRLTDLPNLCIKHFSHLSVLNAPTNPHYGQNGDFILASKHQDSVIYGAYNALELDAYHFLYKFGLTKFKRQELTYNPDFNFMISRMKSFITEV